MIVYDRSLKPVHHFNPAHAKEPFQAGLPLKVAEVFFFGGGGGGDLFHTIIISIFVP